VSDDLLFVWCTYRDWSFHVLEGLLDLPGWRCGLIITTVDCLYDFDGFECRGIDVLRLDPHKDLKPDGIGFQAIRDIAPGAIFYYGWSWFVPPALLSLCPNVTLHPGKLPKDRGGSPIQNQIRNGEDWTYANIIGLVPGLDEGPIYMRQQISLAGDEADAVWARMTAAGAMLSRRFLRSLAAGSLTAEKQDPAITPTLYRRVRPEDAELRPAEQSARQMYDIVRAHNESDANSYVSPAFLVRDSHRLVIERAALARSAVPAERVNLLLFAGDGDGWTEIVHKINNGEVEAVIPAEDESMVYVTRLRFKYL